MSKSAAELRREQRKKELEEKRARLKALRDDKKASVNNTGSPSEPSAKEIAQRKKEEELSHLKGASNVEDLLSALELPTNEKPEEVPSSSPSESAPAVAATAPASERKPAAPLTLQQRLAEFDLPPRIIPTYEKATQTVSVSTDDDEDDDEPSQARTESLSPSHTSEASVAPATSPQAAESTPESKSDAIPTAELSEMEIQRMLYSQDLAMFLDDATRVTERAIQVSSKYDILANYKGESGENQAGSGDSIVLQNTFKDERWTKSRAVTSLHWSPKFPELFLTSYSENASSAQEADGVVLVWTTNNLLDSPEFVFNCQSPVLTAQFSKFQPNIIVGGTYSGQLVLWDTRAKATPVQRSPLSSVGHTHPVYCMDVVGTQNAHNLVSVSTDGTLCAWTLSNLSQPIEQLHLETPPVEGRSAKYSSPAATCLAFEEGQVNQFYVGTEEGAVYHGARHGSTRGLSERFRRAPVDRKDLDQDSPAVDSQFVGHYAPITGMDFHSHEGSVDLSSHFLTSSLDWSVKMWSKRTTERPLRTFQYGSAPVYDVKWSPSHPGIFASGDGSGMLNLWNIGADNEVPVLQEKVSAHSLNKLSWSNDSRKILIGDSSGSVHLYDVGDMCVAEKDEWERVDDAISKFPNPTQTI